jgi:hypothetical protein
MSFYEKLRGTIETIFQIGLGGPQLKDNAGNIDARDPADAAYVNVRGLDPLIPQDLTTKFYVDSIATPANTQRTIRIPIALATVSSVTALSLTDRVFDCRVEIVTPYVFPVAGAITVGQAGSPTIFQVGTDNDPLVASTYDVPQDTAAVAAASVLVTISGAPTAGSGFVVITYGGTLP